MIRIASFAIALALASICLGSGAHAQAVTKLCVSPPGDTTGNCVPVDSAHAFPTAPAGDIRQTNVSVSATLGSFIDIPLNNTGSVGINFVGLTASGATISYFSSNDATRTPVDVINDYNAATGVRSPTKNTDGPARVPTPGRTTLRIQVTTGGTGTFQVSYTATQNNDIVNFSGFPIQGAAANWSQTTDKSCAATTPCTVLSTTAHKYLSVINTTTSGFCRLAYGGATASATLGEPLAGNASGQGGARTFENSYTPQGTVSAYCSVASTLAVMEGN